MNLSLHFDLSRRMSWSLVGGDGSVSAGVGWVDGDAGGVGAGVDRVAGDDAEMIVASKTLR